MGGSRPKHGRVNPLDSTGCVNGLGPGAGKRFGDRYISKFGAPLGAPLGGVVLAARAAPLPLFCPAIKNGPPTVPKQGHPRGVTGVHAPLERNRPMRPRILGRMCNSAEIHTKKCHLFTPRPPPSRQVLDEFWTFMFFKSHKNVTSNRCHQFKLGRGQLL